MFWNAWRARREGREKGRGGLSHIHRVAPILPTGRIESSIASDNDLAAPYKILSVATCQLFGAQRGCGLKVKSFVISEQDYQDK